MRSTLLILIVLVAAAEGQAQLRGRTHSDVRWNKLALINGANQVSRVGRHCGIYSTAQDRQSGNLSIAIDCKSEDHKIRPGFVRDQSAVTIIRRQHTQRFFRSDIYGYRDCRGAEYHFFGDRTYELINPGENIPIYQTFDLKGKQRRARFFFGTRAGDVRPLTLDNLNSEFYDEPQFLRKLHVLATTNFELIKYRYVINRVRQNTLENL